MDLSTSIFISWNTFFLTPDMPSPVPSATLLKTSQSRISSRCKAVVADLPWVGLYTAMKTFLCLPALCVWRSPFSHKRHRRLGAGGSSK